MVTATAVRKRTHQLLEEADLDNFTERQLITTLVKELGDGVKAHEKLIKSIVNEFLAGSDEDEDEELEEEEDSVGTKRKAGSQAARGPGKVPRVEGGELVMALGDKGHKRLTVKAFKGRVLVDLREFWVDKKGDGGEKPSPKGISLSVDQWITLCGALPALAAAQKAGETGGPHVELGRDRRAYLSEFKGVVGLQVREFYKADSELKPGKKGINLDVDAVAGLMSHIPAIDAHVAQLGGSTAAKEGKQEGKKGGQDEGVKATGGDKVEASGAGGSGAAGGGEVCVDLGGGKRASVSTYKGALQVGLREWYEKGGAWLPGKKGINLSVDEWQEVAAAAPAITRALEAKDMAYRLTLGKKRRVSLSEFKGKHYVAVREYYEKGGQELPGQSGLNMTGEQWAALVAGIPTLAASLPQ